MKKLSFSFLKPLSLILSVSAMTALLSGCTASILNEAPNTDPLQSAKPAGSIPALTTPHYFAPITPEKDNTYTPEYQLTLLADRDFGGGIFLVIHEEGLENAIFPSADELTEVYADRRNRLISQKYNVELACISKTAEEILADLAKADKMGEYYADLLVVSPSLFQQLKEKKYLQALDNIPFLELESACIRQEAVTELNSGWSGTYGIWGDALRQPTKGYAVYYDIEQAAAMGAPNFYSQVIDGKFDLASLLNAASEGMLTFDGNAADFLFSLAGINSASDEGKALLESEDHAALLAKFEECRYTPEKGTAKDAFLKGESLFYIGKLGDFSSFAQTQQKIGILPLPKYNAEDADYPHLVDQSTLPILACPIHMNSLEGSGIMLSALNAASCDEIEEIFLQSAEPHVRDNGSALMLPYCVGMIRFDRKLIFGE